MAEDTQLVPHIYYWYCHSLPQTSQNPQTRKYTNFKLSGRGQESYPRISQPPRGFPHVQQLTRALRLLFAPSPLPALSRAAPAWRAGP